jgi:hypothetical protein
MMESLNEQSSLYTLMGGVPAFSWAMALSCLVWG